MAMTGRTRRGARNAQATRRRRPLGVFDSGIGGLTVVRHLLKLLPERRIVYFGDTARVPYGAKSDATVRRFGEEAVKFLSHYDVDAIVVACNTVSAVALRPLQREFRTLPITGVIEPGAEAAVRETRNGRIGVIGTRATVGSGAYEHAIHAAARRAGTRVRVDAIACPLLVPLAEEGMENSRAAREVLGEYLAPLQRRGIDTLILGCTHYPPFRRALRGVLGSRVKLVDSGEATARQFARHAREAARASGRAAKTAGRGAKRARQVRGGLECYVSDIPLQFERIGRHFLGRAMGKVGLIPQDDLPWFERNPIQGGR